MNSRCKLFHKIFHIENMYYQKQMTKSKNSRISQDSQSNSKTRTENKGGEKGTSSL